MVPFIVSTIQPQVAGQSRPIVSSTTQWPRRGVAAATRCRWPPGQEDATSQGQFGATTAMCISSCLSDTGNYDSAPSRGAVPAHCFQHNPMAPPRGSSGNSLPVAARPRGCDIPRSIWRNNSYVHILLSFRHWQLVASATRGRCPTYDSGPYLRANV